MKINISEGHKYTISQYRKIVQYKVCQSFKLTETFKNCLLILNWPNVLEELKYSFHQSTKNFPNSTPQTTCEYFERTQIYLFLVPTKNLRASIPAVYYTSGQYLYVYTLSSCITFYIKLLENKSYSVLHFYKLKELTPWLENVSYLHTSSF